MWSTGYSNFVLFKLVSGLGSVFCFVPLPCCPGSMTHGILIPNQGWNLWPLQWKLRVLTTRLPGKSLGPTSSLCSSASFLHNPTLHVPAGIPHLCHLISSLLLAKTNSCFPMKHTSFQLYLSRLDVFCPASLQVCGMFNVFRSSC